MEASADADWLKHVDKLGPDLVCAHEHGRIEMKAKLTDGKTPAHVVWNLHVVRFRRGVVVGDGSSAKTAWLDALDVATRVVAVVEET